MVWWIWCVGGLVLLMGELTTPGGFYLLFMGISALIVGVGAGVGVLTYPAAQWIIFALLSLVLLFGLRRKLVGKLGIHAASQDLDSVVGELCTAGEKIAPEDYGKVELRGTVWKAKNISAREIREGERVTIKALEGLTVHIEPL